MSNYQRHLGATRDYYRDYEKLGEAIIVMHDQRLRVTMRDSQRLLEAIRDYEGYQ